VTNLLRLAVTMQHGITALNEVVGDPIFKSRDLADVVDAVPEQVVSDKLDDFHFLFPS
jgi:hypothetical protein